MSFHTVYILFYVIFGIASCAILNRMIRPFDDNKIKEGVFVVNCYDEITTEMAETYESFVVYADDPETCAIFLPQNVDVSFLELNFTHPKTFARVVVGARRKTATYLYSPVYATNATDDYGIFRVPCPFGLVTFHPTDSTYRESLEFIVERIYEPINWAKTCPDVPSRKKNIVQII